MSITIINGFSTYSHRVELLYNYFKKNKIEVNVLYADFNHIKKERYEINNPDYIPIPTKPYHKNLSFKRLYSHRSFAKKAMKVAEEYLPRTIYVVLPPNSLAHFAKKYKNRHKDIQLVYDVIDMWPETLPFKHTSDIFPFTLWRNMRNNNLKYADLIVAECNLFKNIIEKKNENLEVKTLYMANKDVPINIEPNLMKDSLDICYLGSINNIIDIDKIILILRELNKKNKVFLHIIGDGEKKEMFIEQLKANNIKFEYYGKIYDYKKKESILNKCRFGINIMKDTVCVGLTMKSIDYLQFGVPLINNIEEDTEQLVEQYGIGFNVSSDYKTLAEKIDSLTDDSYIHMKYESVEVYKKYFSESKFNENAKKIFGLLK